MKKTILTGIMSLFMAFNVFAGGDNSVYIDQTNADNSTLTITQTGSGNSVGDRTNLITPAFIIEGNSMNITFNQDGMNNSIVGNLINGDTTAVINQIGSGNSTTLTQGNFGTNGGNLNIGLTGDNNTTAFTFASTHNTNNYYYNLTVAGNTNAITSTMNSKYIHNTVSITGNNNTVTSTQNGADGTSSTPGHKIEATIIGNYNTLTISQTGTTNPNIITLNVAGNNTSTTITQY